MTIKPYLIASMTINWLMVATLLCGCGTTGIGLLDGGDSTSSGDTSNGTDAVAGTLQIKAIADALGSAAQLFPSGLDAPDDVDVNLTPLECTFAFKRIVLKEVDEETEATLSEIEVFSADTVDDALIVDLLDTAASDVLDVKELTDGTYNKVDIEVFYLDMTIPTLYPGQTSHDIAYRMVYEEMDVLEPRDFLIYLDPSWMESGTELASAVMNTGWYWMEREDPDHVEPVAGASAHPEFNVLDLFADDEFWSSAHKVLEGGRIEPPLEYDSKTGGILTITFDVTGMFNFKDYYDEATPADGLWEIRLDGGIHPFPPNFDCSPESASGSLISL